MRYQGFMLVTRLHLIHTFCAKMETGKNLSYCQVRTLRIISDKGALSAQQIAAEFPATLRTIQRVLNALHSTHAVFIQDYRRNARGGNPRKFWAAGSAKDAPRPAPTTSAERALTRRRALTAEERDFIRARARALARKPRRDPLTRAFFGPAPRARNFAS